MLWPPWLPNVLVVDASVAGPAVADGGPYGARCRNRLRGERLAAPDLLGVEVLSMLRRQVGRAELALAQAEGAIVDLLDLPVMIYPTALLLRRMWQLRDNLTSYDACYLALAEALDAPLLTRDSRLARVPAVRCAVEVLV
jgi:predicted nucleic acid-binding protein